MLLLIEFVIEPVFTVGIAIDIELWFTFIRKYVIWWVFYMDIMYLIHLLFIGL